MKNWNHREVWMRRGNGFCIEVVHKKETFDQVTEDRWNVECYIYPTHPHFPNFKGDAMFQEAACALPLHRGPSLLIWHGKPDGTINSVQVGADYNHLYDEIYTSMDAETAQPVFRDAEELFEYLETFRTDKYANI